MLKILLIIVIILQGCAASPEIQRVYDTSSPEIQQVIDQRKIRVGMTKDQVIASWGRPFGCYSNGSRYSDGTSTWRYCSLFGSGGNILFFDENDKVEDWIEY